MRTFQIVIFNPHRKALRYCREALGAVKGTVRGLGGQSGVEMKYTAASPERVRGWSGSTGKWLKGNFNAIGAGRTVF